MTLPALQLVNMADRHPGLTPALAEAYLEAARVCLDRHHIPPQEFSIENDEVQSLATVDWLPADERCGQPDISGSPGSTRKLAACHNGIDYRHAVPPPRNHFL